MQVHLVIQIFNVKIVPTYVLSNSTSVPCYDSYFYEYSKFIIHQKAVTQAAMLIVLILIVLRVQIHLKKAILNVILAIL